MSKTIRFEAIYPFAPEQVWTALTDPEALADWLMPNDFKAEVGHRFQFRTRPAPGFDGTVHCEVLEVDRPHRLAYQWRGGDIDTVVSFDLMAEGSSTRLVMQQSGFAGVRGAMVAKILSGGWKGMIERGVLRAASKVRDGRYVRGTDP
jgi:uncharacterized protein YndB with AHSA1/START domain